MPLFAEHDSFYRLVQRACAPLPADRFQSAEDLRVQAMGVLREVVARRSPGAATTSAPSTLFSTPMTAGEGFDWRQLPRLLPDPADPMTSWIACTNTTSRVWKRKKRRNKIFFLRCS